MNLNKINLKRFVFLVLCFQFAHLSQIYAEPTPPPLPPVSPGMCERMPEMPGCPQAPPPLPPDIGVPQSNRLRGTFNPFSYVEGGAPGIEEYKNLGYCTGIVEPASSSSDSQKSKSLSYVRKYYFVASTDVEVDSKVKFLKFSLKPQYGKSCGNPSHFDPAELIRKNRAINAPALFFNEGETAEIHIENKSGMPITIHWHGLILPNNQDGVPNITQAPIAKDAKDFVYSFKLKQDGTYWYHPHDLNEQHTKGPFIIFPKQGYEMITQKFSKNPSMETRYHKDRIVFLTDYNKKSPDLILNQIRNNQGTYTFDSGFQRGFLQQIGCIKEYLDNFKAMKMFWMDKADVWYDSFFINDETCLNCSGNAEGLEFVHKENEKQLFQKINEFSSIRTGDRTRLRIINASASSYFFVDYSNSKNLPGNRKSDLLVVAKDGQPVAPIYVDQLYMGPGETYDVIADMPIVNSGANQGDDTSYELRIKSIDDVNNKLNARLIMGSGNKIKQAYDQPVQLCGEYPENDDPPSKVTYADLNRRFESTIFNPKSGRTDLNVKDPFEYIVPNKKTSNYYLTLSGNMDDYYWRIDGDKGTNIMADSFGIPYLELVEGARNRITIDNSMMMGMMNHPWHLHGLFFRMASEAELNGLSERQIDELMAQRPLLHTATIFPGQTVVLEIYADPATPGSWMFHCHNLYHMANSMMMYVTYGVSGEKGNSHLHDAGKNYSSKKIKWNLLSGLANMSNQYVTAGAGAHVGMNGSGMDVQLNYRGNLGGNQGYIDAIVAASKDINKEKTLELNTTVRHCVRVNECVYIDLNLERGLEQTKTTGYVGKTVRVYNSEIAVVDGAVGAQNKIDRETGQSVTKPAARLTGALSIPIGWNITATARGGCEGAYCSEAFAEFSAKLRASPNVTFTLFNCKGSTDKDETGCFANIMIGSDPFSFGAGH